MDNQAFNEIFANEVKTRIFEDNSFLTKFANVSSYLSGKFVHIPNYTTSASAVVINGSNFDYNDFSQTAEQFLTFQVDTYRLKPIQIENFETSIVPYDKIQLVTKEKIAELSDQIAKTVLNKLAKGVTSGRKIFTTGNVGTANGAGGGNKHKIQFADIVNLKVLMDGDNIPGDGRILMIDNVQNGELLQDDQIVKYMNFGTPTSIEGKVQTLMGFTIMVKPTISYASTSGVVATYAQGNTPASTDSRVALAFHPDFPLRAESEVKVYSQTDVAQLYGSVISSEVWLGVANPRIDGKGVYLMYQG